MKICSRIDVTVWGIVQPTIILFDSVTTFFKKSFDIETSKKFCHKRQLLMELIT